MKTIVTLVLFLLLAVQSSFAAGGNVKLYGDLEFPDTTVQKTATVQGPIGLQGIQGDTGPQGPAGPACKPTLTDICEGILTGGAARPTFCPAATLSATTTIAKTSLVTSETTTVSSTFKSNGLPVAGITVTFTTTLGSVSPLTAVTNASGTATTQLTAGATAGQGVVTASATIGGILVTGNGLFNENLPKLSPITLGLATLSYGGSTSVSVTVKDANGNAYSGPELSVVFTKSSATSIINSPIKTAFGVATTTYQAVTTSGTDTITATIAGDSSTAVTTTISIAPPSANSIQFVSVQPKNIGLKGMGETGFVETALVTFKVLDTLGQPKPNQLVNFSLNSTIGGLALTSPSGSTAFDGTVSVYVQAGTIATSVRVTATIAGTSPAISTQSNQLVVSTGVPAQDGFSISIEKLNPGSFNIDGVTSTVTARLSDHFHNPVPDGTAVYFTTSGGMIHPSCTTLDGACSVTWISQNPRPVNNSPANNGRAVILAYAIGEEAFLDINGNGVADPGEFTDTSEAFRDDNENGIRDADETFIDFNRDGIFNGPDTLYNGVLQGAAYITAPRTKHIYSNSVIVMASNTPLFSNSCGSAITVLLNSVKDCIITVSDINGNTMPAGARVEFAITTTMVGTITGATGPIAGTALNLASSTYTFPNWTFDSAVPIPITISDANTITASRGKLTVTVTSGGVVTTKIYDVN